MGKSPQKHYKNFHKEINSLTVALTFLGQKILRIST